jgi:hypothetical protein
MKPGNLEQGFCGGTDKPILAAKPSIFPYIFPRILPQDSQASLSNPGLFHTLDIYTEPVASGPGIGTKGADAGVGVAGQSPTF